MSSLELRHFRYFVAVAEERHFGRAAERLRITQPGLSKQIKRLERFLGGQLLVRHSRGVDLTPAGHVFLQQARQVVQLADRAVTTAANAKRGKKGLLRVGTPILGIPPVAETVLQEFMDRFPDVDIEAYPRLHPDLIDAVSTHTLDLAVVLAPFKRVDPPPRYLQLGKYELGAAVPEGHALAQFQRVPRSELLKEPFLDWPRNINPEMIDHIHRLLFGELEHPRTLSLPQLEEARRLELVAKGRGIGVTVLPADSQRHVPGVAVRPFDEPTPFIGYGIAWVDGRSAPFVEDFLALAREFTESEPGSVSN